MKVQISPLLGFERNFWPSPELLQGILAWSMDPRVTGPNDKYEYIPAIGFTTSQAARNHLCDIFLDQGDCDYLIMIDNDMKPLHPVTYELANVMHLPAMGLPVVAAPTAVMKGLNWFINGYYKDYEDGWRAMSLEELQYPNPRHVVNTQWGPAVLVDSVGFGCVCIRRDVVEKVRASGIDFLDATNRRVGKTSLGLVTPVSSQRVSLDNSEPAKGIAITRNRTPRGETHAGEDMLFGPRTKALGFDTFMAPACIMGHYHTVDLAQMTALKPSLKFPDYGLTHPHPMPDEWSISVELANYLRSLVRETKPWCIVELGSGISTFVLAEEAMGIDGWNIGQISVVSMEENKKQATRLNKLLKQGGLDAATVYHVPLDESGFYSHYQGAMKADLVLVDGPSGQHESRFHARRFFHMLRDGAYVILDDTHRPYESGAIGGWKDEFHMDVVTEIVELGSGRKSTVMVYRGRK